MVISSCAYLQTSKILQRLENLDKISIAWKCSDDEIATNSFSFLVLPSKSAKIGSFLPLNEPIILGCWFRSSKG